MDGIPKIFENIKRKRTLGVGMFRVELDRNTQKQRVINSKKNKALFQKEKVNPVFYLAQL